MEQRLIYLVRHGAIETKGGKRFIGQIDLPMSTEGVFQANRLREELSCVHFSQVFCSDLQRTRQTADIIAHKRGIKPIGCEELREISLGEWEGLYFEEVRRKFPNDFMQRGRDIVNFCPPGGESFKQCSKRVLAKFEDLVQNTKGHILIAGHAGVNRLIICYILGMPLENLFRISQDYCCLNLFVYQNDKFRVKVLNKVYRLIPV